MDFIRFKEINDKKFNFGELDNPTIVSTFKNAACGDDYRIFLKLDSENKIMDASFTTTGCGFSVASLSVMIDLIKNKSVEEAKKLKPIDIDNAFTFPERRKSYPEIAIQALQKALGEIGHSQ
ncbi:MAG: iron-sulfur cluster assembly scaffold protein [Leptospiraceae bacterium]|nr:iron-sulfur cluster assembly scaffold protein [Leptospiraceae bacterium]